jgi:hypothetical protein
MSTNRTQHENNNEHQQVQWETLTTTNRTYHKGNNDHQHSMTNNNKAQKGMLMSNET